MIEQTFKFEQSLAAFITLADTLYSDKILAVCREYMTNARDAHISAGIEDKPFEVSVPTYQSPVFRVRDFGHGLSEDEMSLFITFFHSESRSDVDKTGSFGLGSKSAFAYTDGFTIISYQDGVKKVYLASFDRRTLPTLTLASTSTTVEPDGLEILITVSLGDVTGFTANIQDLAVWFDPIPAGVEVQELEIVLRDPDDSWLIIRDDNIYRGFEYQLVQSSVAYPLRTAQVGGKSILTSHYYLAVRVTSNTCQVTPSRESLSFDPISAASVRSEIEGAQERIIDYVNAKLNKCSTAIAAAILAHTEFPFIKPGHLTYGGEPLPTQVTWNIKDYPFELPPIIQNSMTTKVITEFKKPVSALPFMQFIIDDGTSVPRKRLRIRKFATMNTYTLLNPTSEQLTFLSSVFEIPSERIIKTIDLPDVEVVTRQKGVSRSGIYRYNGGLHKSEWDSKDEYLWLAAESAQSTAALKTPKDLPLLRFTKDQTVCHVNSLHHFTQVAAALGMDFTQKPIMVLLPQALKRINPDLKDNFFVVLNDLIASSKDRILEAAYNARLAGLSEELKLFLDIQVITPFVGWNKDLLSKVYEAEIAEQQIKADLLISRLKSLYPMAFRPDKDAKIAYKKLVDWSINAGYQP